MIMWKVYVKKKETNAVLAIEPIERNRRPSAVRFDSFKAWCGAVRSCVDKKFGSKGGAVRGQVDMFDVA
jgi:hypothetical protein